MKKSAAYFLLLIFPAYGFTAVHNDAYHWLDVMDNLPFVILEQHILHHTNGFHFDTVCGGPFQVPSFIGNVHSSFGQPDNARVGARDYRYERHTSSEQLARHSPPPHVKSVQNIIEEQLNSGVAIDGRQMLSETQAFSINEGRYKAACLANLAYE